MKRGVGGAVKVVAAGADVLRPDAAGLVILIYHRVGARTTGIGAVSPRHSAVRQRGGIGSVT